MINITVTICCNELLTLRNFVCFEIHQGLPVEPAQSTDNTVAIFFLCDLFVHLEVMPKQQKRSTSSANAGGGVDDFVPDGTLDDDFFVGEKEEQEEEDNDER